MAVADDIKSTIVSEDVYMQYVTSKEEDNKTEVENSIDKLKTLGDKSVVRCRTCGQDHWTTKCPWKDTVLVGGKLPDDKKGSATTGSGFTTTETSKPGGSKYVPPNMRDGAAKRPDNPNMTRRDDTTAIRVVNLSESTTENDLEDLVKPFGPIQKLYLAKYEVTGACKGFAYIHFKFRNDAAKAIAALNGHGYDHHILTVHWFKPPTQNSIDKLKTLGDKSVVRCSTCGQDHWTTECPWKDTVLVGGKLPDDKKGSATTGSGKIFANNFYQFCHWFKPPTQNSIDKLKSIFGDKSVVRCRTCGQDHWTTECSWKDTVLVGGKLPDDKKGSATTGSGFTTTETSKPGGSKYVPPNMRDGAAKRPDNPNMTRRDDTTVIRVVNLSESTTENDLEDLVKPFGPIQKLYLAKYEITGACKGFAYIHFKFRNDAAKAIAALNGHGYDHLILSVDWSKPPTHFNQ